MIAAAKAQSGAVAYGTIGAGSLAQLAMSQIGNALDVTMTHVPYKGGGPLVNDAIAGHVPIAIASIALFSPHIKSGALRALAVTSVKRAHATAGHAGRQRAARFPGFDAEAWWGLLAPAKTPPEIVARMNAAMVEALNDPMVKQSLSEQGRRLSTVLAGCLRPISSKARSTAGPRWSRTTTSW